MKWSVSHVNHILTGLATKCGNLLIEIAVYKGKLDVIRYLVTEQGVNINGEFYRVLRTQLHCTFCFADIMTICSCINCESNNLTHHRAFNFQ